MRAERGRALEPVEIMETQKPGKGRELGTKELLLCSTLKESKGLSKTKRLETWIKAGAKRMMASTKHVSGEPTKTVVLKAFGACGFYL